MDEPTPGPIDVGPEKPLPKSLMNVLQELSKPDAVMFTVRAGRAGVLMGGPGFSTQKIPAGWIKSLVRRGLIERPIGSGNKVACMNWIQYTLAYEGQQVLNRRR